MDILQSHAGIIDILLSHSMPEGFIPYNILLLLSTIFVVAVWVLSKTVKRLRYKEYELQQQVSKLEHQHDRDSKEKEKLRSQIQQLIVDEEDDEAVHNPP